MMVVGLLVLSSAVCDAIPTAVHAAPVELITASLENARRDLEINRALETRTAAALANLKQTGQATPEIIADYEAYLGRVRAMAAENQKLVQRLEAMHLQQTVPGSSQLTSAAGALSARTDAPIPEEAVTDEIAALDRELNASLAEFDDMLLEELKLIRAKSSLTIDSLAQEAAEAAERLRSKGIDIDLPPSKAEPGLDPSRQATVSGAKTDPPPAETSPDEADRMAGSGSPNESADHAAEGVEGNRQKRTERYGSSDDDIVARQLREAAEQETDPVLKEKLWQEYDAYKRSGK
jgi:hypothetical protein